MLEDADISRLKEVFQTKDGCRSNYCELEDKVNSIDTRTTKIDAKMDTIVWLLRIIAGAIVTGIVGAILALILK